MFRLGDMPKLLMQVAGSAVYTDTLVAKMNYSDNEHS
jgi:hypothetical protein